MTENAASVISVRRIALAAASERAAMMVLAGEERDRAAAFRNVEARRRFVLARAALRRLLADRLGVAPEAIAFAYGPHGKPMLAQPIAAAPFDFSVAHCEDLALIACGGCARLGIDVERRDRVVAALDIASRVLAPAICARLAALPEPQRSAAFLAAWVEHEARGKAIGTGMIIDAAHRDAAATLQVIAVDCGAAHIAAIAADRAARIDLADA
jgi:4'-phosphopantetheinyl transferase